MKFEIDTETIHKNKYVIVGIVVFMLLILLFINPWLFLNFALLIPFLLVNLIWILFAMSFSMKGFLNTALEYIEHKKSKDKLDFQTYRKSCRLIYYKMMGWMMLFHFGWLIPFYVINLYLVYFFG